MTKKDISNFVRPLKDILKKGRRKTTASFYPEKKVAVAALVDAKYVNFL
jgi:hypothetical protein